MEDMLPEDIVAEILSLLPVKSLIRFRSVCKGWHTLFQNQDFISKHHNNQIAHSNFTVIVGHGKLRVERISLLSSNGGGLVPALLPTRICECHEPFSMLGHVNGLFYLYNCCDMGSLWNPATRESKHLPESLIKPFPGSIRRLMFYGHGFGYDSKTSDYKIIRFVINVIDENWSLKDQVELYSLKNDSWKEIPYLENDNACVYEESVFNAYNDGFYYWAAGIRGSGYCTFIACFNFADEVFENLPLPDFGFSMQEAVPAITVFNGMLSVIVKNNQDSSEWWIEIWVMKEYGVKESWAKQQTIGFVEGIQHSFVFWKNRIFFEDEEGMLVLYDPSTGEVRNLLVDWGRGRWRVEKYVESLVPLTIR